MVLSHWVLLISAKPSREMCDVIFRWQQLASVSILENIVVFTFANNMVLLLSCRIYLCQHRISNYSDYKLFEEKFFQKPILLIDNMCIFIYCAYIANNADNQKRFPAFCIICSWFLLT